MRYEEVLSFWFGELNADGCADDEHALRWWRKDETFDVVVGDRFGGLHADIVDKRQEEWLASPRGRLAYIIVLDQFSRNMFRGTRNMFTTDDRALHAAIDGLTKGDDSALALDETVFLYMPFMHAEALEHQERCVSLFVHLAARTPTHLRDRVTNNVRFAEAHRDIIQRFGRFPHRNLLLGRESTPEEREFLKQPGSSF